MSQVGGMGAAFAQRINQQKSQKTTTTAGRGRADDRGRVSFAA
jgi:hypothetical protein